MGVASFQGRVRVSGHVVEDEIEARSVIVGDLDRPAVDADDLLDGGQAQACLAADPGHEGQEDVLGPGPGGREP